MPMIALALPIPPERYATWRAAVTSFAGERRAEYGASRRRLGVLRTCSWVQETPQGPLELLVVEAADDP